MWKIPPWIATRPNAGWEEITVSPTPTPRSMYPIWDTAPNATSRPRSICTTAIRAATTRVSIPSPTTSHPIAGSTTPP